MVRSPRNLAFGLFLAALAAIGLWGIRNLRLGTALEMGAGYLPALMCAALAIIAAVKLIEGFVIEGDAIEPTVWMPIAATVAAIAAFGYAVEPLGLVAATMMLVLIATLGTPDRNWPMALLFAGSLAAACVVVFIYLLRIPFSVWPHSWS